MFVDDHGPHPSIEYESVGDFGKVCEERYVAKLKSAEHKLEVIRTAFKELAKGCPEEISHRLAKLVTYYSKDDAVFRNPHRSVNELRIPNAYFKWVAFSDMDIAIVDAKKYPFLVSVRGKYSQVEVKQWRENLETGDSL